MPTYLDYKKQIDGLDSVNQTVKTVEKVAASHLRLVKPKVEYHKDLVEKLKRILLRLCQFTPLVRHPWTANVKTKPKALLVLSSDKGLVGGLFHNLAEKVLTRFQDYDQLWVIGSRGAKALEQVNVTNYQLLGNDLELEEAIVPLILQQIETSQLYQLDVLYLESLSVSIQKVSSQTVLPLSAKRLKSPDMPKAETGLPIFETSKATMMQQLAKQYVIALLHQLITETKHAELSARMVTSEHAAAKAQEMVQNLKRRYLTERRHILTQQQLSSYSAHLPQT